jgi:hypothetical protein
MACCFEEEEEEDVPVRGRLLLDNGEEAVVGRVPDQGRGWGRFV